MNCQKPSFSHLSALQNLALLFSVAMSGLLWSPAIKCSEMPARNLDLIDSLVLGGVYQVYEQLQNLGFKSYNVDFGAHPADWLVEQHLFREVDGADIRLLRKPRTDTNALLQLHIRHLGPTYSLYDPHSDSLIREVSLDLRAQIQYGNGKINVLSIAAESSVDTIARSELVFLESKQHSFANAPVPEAPTGVFTEIVEPLVMVSAAILTVVLLFTVRSQ